MKQNKEKRKIILTLRKPEILEEDNIYWFIEGFKVDKRRFFKYIQYTSFSKEPFQKYKTYEAREVNTKENPLSNPNWNHGYFITPTATEDYSSMISHLNELSLENKAQIDYFHLIFDVADLKQKRAEIFSLLKSIEALLVQ